MKLARDTTRDVRGSIGVNKPGTEGDVRLGTKRASGRVKSRRARYCKYRKVATYCGMSIDMNEALKALDNPARLTILGWLEGSA